MANELLGLDWVLGSLIVIGNRRGSEVVALDGEPMWLVELSEHLRPLVSRVFTVPTREHDLGVRSTNGALISFDGIDCLLVKHDSASGGLLCYYVQLDVAIFVGFELRDGAKGQADSVLYTQGTCIQDRDQGIDHFRLSAGNLEYLAKLLFAVCLVIIDLGPIDVGVMSRLDMLQIYR